MIDKKPLELEDLYQFVGLGQVALSPDGYWVAFVHTLADKASNGYKRNLWLVRLSDGNAFQFTRSGKDGHPKWLPDSKSLLFTSARGEKSQIFRIRVDAPGGEAYPITDVTNGVSEFSISPDGTRIAFLSVMSAAEREAEDAGEPLTSLDEKRFDPRVVRSVPYRAGTSYISDQFPQIFVADVTDSDQLLQSRRLTGVDATQSIPRWSADGTKLYTDRTTRVGKDEPGRHTQIHILDVETGDFTAIKDGDHVTSAPLPSSDGRYIAYQRYPYEGMSLKHDVISIMSASTYDEVRDVNHEIDRATVKFAWGGEPLYALVQDSGKGFIYRISPETGASTRVFEHDSKINDFDVLESGDIAFVGSTFSELQELYLFRANSGEIRKLTEFNRSYVEQTRLQDIQSLIFSVDGREIQGWYLLPVDYSEDERYPLVVNVHGGPHIMWGAHDESKWQEWQYYAVHGFAVFFCNPRGSGGYGNAFQEAVFAEWSSAMSDVMTGVDLLIEKGIADPERLVLTGGSYGGYLTTWMVSHSDRFKAAVSQRGVYNLISFFGTTDIPSFLHNEFGYTPLENPDFLWKHSPLAYAQDINTPLLIMHSENDFRVPISEAEQLFGHMRRAGKTVEFVRYPREGHELSRAGEPEHRIDRMRRILDWFKLHLG